MCISQISKRASCIGTMESIKSDVNVANAQCFYPFEANIETTAVWSVLHFVWSESNFLPKYCLVGLGLCRMYTSIWVCISVILNLNLWDTYNACIQVRRTHSGKRVPFFRDWVPLVTFLGPYFFLLQTRSDQLMTSPDHCRTLPDHYGGVTNERPWGSTMENWTCPQKCPKQWPNEWAPLG